MAGKMDPGLRLRSAAALACGILLGAGARGGTIVEPPSLLLLNPDRVLVGSQGGLEGGALLCRAKAAEAGWYNPAGLVRCRAPSISGNASAYELVTSRFTSGDTVAASSNISTLPSFVGSSDWITTDDEGLGKLAWGFSVVTPLSWHSSVSSYEEFAPAVNWEGRVTAKSDAQVETLGLGATLSYAYTPPYAPPPRFTMGASMYLYMSSLGIHEAKFDDRVDTVGGDVTTVTRDYGLSMDAYHLGLTLGLYASPVKGWEMALVTRLPAIKLGATGSLDEHELAVDDTSSPYYDELDAHESGVEVDWRVPLEVSAGVSWKAEKFQVEFDLNYHAGTGTYDVFPAGLYDVRFGDTPPYTDTTAVRDALTTTGRGILNFAIGARYELSETKRIHAGIRTALSPVESSADEDIFAAVDLTLLTFGMSKQTERTFTSYGLVVGLGSTDEFALEDLVSGGTVGGSLSLRTIGVVVGASFKL